MHARRGAFCVRILGVAALVSTALGCGGNGSDDVAFTRADVVGLQAVAPELPALASVPFTLTGLDFGNLPGTRVTVRFIAAEGTPFENGTSSVATVRATIRDAQSVEGLSPTARVPDGEDVEAGVEVVLPSGFVGASAGPIVTFRAPRILAVQNAADDAPYAGTDEVRGAQPGGIAIEGVGFEPAGAFVDVVFTSADGRAIFEGGAATSAIVRGRIEASDTVVCRAPRAVVHGAVVCRAGIELVFADGSVAASAEPAPTIAFVLDQPTVPDLVSAFVNLRTYGDWLGFWSNTAVAEMPSGMDTAHYQGMQRYHEASRDRSYLVMSRSATSSADPALGPAFDTVDMASRSARRGERLRSNRLVNDKASRDSPPRLTDRVGAAERVYDYLHPGGVQMAGNILAIAYADIAVEGEAPPAGLSPGAIGFVRYLDRAPGTPGSTPPATATYAYELPVEEGLGAVGFVRLADGHFLLAAGNLPADRVYFYKSRARTVTGLHEDLLAAGDPGSTAPAPFVHVSTFHESELIAAGLDSQWPSQGGSFTSSGAIQNISLVRQDDGRVFFVGTWNTEMASPFIGFAKDVAEGGAPATTSALYAVLPAVAIFPGGPLVGLVAAIVADVFLDNYFDMAFCYELLDVGGDPAAGAVGPIRVRSAAERYVFLECVGRDEDGIIAPILALSSVNGNFNANGNTYVSPTGELLLYSAGHGTYGPFDTTSVAELRHVDIVRPDHPSRLPSLDPGGTDLGRGAGVYVVDEGQSVTFNVSAAPPSARPWIELYEDDTFGKRSILFDWDDRGILTEEDFKKLDGDPREVGPKRGFNDQVSSVRWYAPPGVSFELYEDDANDGFEGKKVTLAGNGRVRSFSDLHEDPVLGQTGDHRTSTTWDDGSTGLGDKFSAIRFVGTPPSGYGPLAFAWTGSTGASGPATYGLSSASARNPTLDATSGDGPQTLRLDVTVTAFGDASIATQGQVEVLVRNVAPALVPAAPSATARVGQPFTLGPLAIEDPGVHDTHTVVFDWGDNTPPTRIEDAPRTGIEASHTYYFPGTYPVRIEVTDDDGGRRVHTAEVVVQ